MKTILVQLKRLLENRPVSFLAAVAAVISVIHLSTAGEYPPAWFDEIEILEIGRFSLFDVNPRWSVNLMPGSDGTLVPPMPYFHYLSGAVLESLYRLTGSFLCGRALMLLSLPFCALSLYGYLKGKAVSMPAAVLAALLMLLDPNAAVCAHWYRPDLWCLSFMFAAMALVARSRSTGRPRLLLAAAGALSATAVFFWITAALLAPLVALEFVLACRARANEPSARKAFPALCSFSAGGIAVSCLYLLPLCPYIPGIVRQYFATGELATMTAAGNAPVSAVLSRALDFVKIACRSPFVWGAALAGIAVTWKYAAHALLFALTAAFMLSTRVYHLRMVYLMPYLFLFAAVAVDRLAVHRGKTVAGLLARGYVLLALSFGFSLSAAAMNYAAWPEKNTLELFSEKLGSVIKTAKPQVCLVDFEHELYYAGRALGWEMYSTSDRKLILREPFADSLNKMDAIVVTSPMSLSGEERRIVASHGFSLAGRVDMPPAATGAIKGRLAEIFYAHGYPSCEIWTKSRPVSTPAEGVALF